MVEEAMMSTLSGPSKGYIKKGQDVNKKNTLDFSSIGNIKGIGGIQGVAGNKTGATVSQIESEAKKLQPIGRINKTNPVEDDLLLGVAYDITGGQDPKTVIDAYPEVDVKKIDALGGYIYDAQDLNIDQTELFDAYPELSIGVKSKIRSQFKDAIEKETAQADLETNPMGIKEGAGAFALGTAQGVSNVGYKIMGKKINELGAKLGEKLKDNKAAKDITLRIAKNLMGASDEDIKTYQQSEQLRKQSEDPYSSQQNANVLRSVGGRRFEQSSYGKAGVTAGEFAGETALEMAAGGLAGGAMKKIIGGTAKTVIGKRIKSGLVGGVAGAAGTTAKTLVEEGRLPTAKELKTGTLFGTVGGTLFAGQITRTDRNIGDYLLKGLSKSELDDRAASMGLEKGMFGKIKNVFSSSEKKMIDATKGIINPKKTTVENINKLGKISRQESKKLEDIVSKYKYKANIKNVIGEFNKIEPPQSLKSDPILYKTYEVVKNKYLDAIKATDMSPASILKVRKTFDKIIEREIPSLWSTPASNPMKMAVLDLRRVPNKIVNNLVGDDIVAKSLEKQSLMLDAIALLKSRAEKAGTTTLSRRAKRNKELLKVGGLVVAGAAGSRAVSAGGQQVE